MGQSHSTLSSPPSLDALDYQLILGLESRPGVSLTEIARTLGVPWATISRRAQRLKAHGVVRSVAIICPRGASRFESIALIRCDWTSPQLVTNLERSLALDPAVISIAMISGRFDFQLELLHQSAAAVRGWALHWQPHPAVASIELKPVKHLIRRHSYAAALGARAFRDIRVRRF